jgi:hypothetical protein
LRLLESWQLYFKEYPGAEPDPQYKRRALFEGEVAGAGREGVPQYLPVDPKTPKNKLLAWRYAGVR